MKHKKTLIAAVGLLLLLGLGFAVYSATKKPAETTEAPAPKKKTTLRNYNVIEVSERPYLQIKPIDARNISIVVSEVKKEATVADYELEYQTGTLVQGAFGQITLATLPTIEKILFGSCSAGGACTYHEDIKGGELRAFFSGGAEAYDLKSNWRYFENTQKETAFSSKDAFFQIDSTSLATARLLVVYNSPGYPGEVEGELVSEVYSLASSAPLTGTATLSIRSREEGNLTIMGWDGSKWNTFETTSDGKTATATVDLAEAYVVVRE